MSRYFKVSEPIPSPVMVYESNGDIVFYSRGTEILRMNDRFVVLYGSSSRSLRLIARIPCISFLSSRKICFLSLWPAVFSQTIMVFGHFRSNFSVHNFKNSSSKLLLMKKKFRCSPLFRQKQSENKLIDQRESPPPVMRSITGGAPI